MASDVATTLAVDEFVTGILAGDRAVLARAITLVESSKRSHQSRAQDLLQELLPYTGKSHRIGITGVPGVGKSTTIEQLGLNLTALGHKVAVLAVDPTSSRSGGSILGDKTRMPRLSVDQKAFIRPSPTSGTLGGVTKRTRETMALCEAAGYDIVLVETVGVGQSETSVADMVDFFLVLMLPGAGDELQGIKKGVIEIADMIAVNKADGENVTRAKLAAGHYLAALHILTPASENWSPPVKLISGLRDLGLDELWSAIKEHQARLKRSGEFQERRADQAVRWMYDMLDHRIKALLLGKTEVAERLPLIEAEVRGGQKTATLAVNEVLDLVQTGKN